MEVDLECITKEVVKNMENNALELSVVKDIAIIGMECMNPMYGVSAHVGDTFLSKFDEFKLKHLLLGLNKEDNVEKRINELYRYVSSSGHKAYQVGNILKETLAAESPKACVILGIILARNIDKQTDFSREDLIVSKAVENANDFDLDNFKDLMKNCIQRQDDGKRRVVYNTKDIKKITEYDMTCKWGIYNRLFTKSDMEWEAFGNATLNITPSQYYVENPADILIGLIDEVQQIWEYES